MTLQEIAKNYLKYDSLLHMDMLESIRRENAEIIYASPDGVLLLDRPSGTHMISTERTDTAQEMIRLMKNVTLIECHQKFYADALADKFHLCTGPDCYQAVYLEKQAPVQNEIDVRIQPLDHTFLSSVKAQYHMVQDDQYLLDRLDSGLMFGAFQGEELAGFIGMHAEGSIGLLEVFPPYRRLGIGMALEVYIANVMLERGWTPFGQIIVGNTASFRLQKKLGFSIAEQPLFWMDAETAWNGQSEM